MASMHMHKHVHMNTYMHFILYTHLIHSHIDIHKHKEQKLTLKNFKEINHAYYDLTNDLILRIEETHNSQIPWN